MRDGQNPKILNPVFCSIAPQPPQKATIALEALPFFEEEAKKRMSLGGQGKQKIADLPRQSRDDAASLVGTNRQYVSDAKAIKKSSPANPMQGQD